MNPRWLLIIFIFSSYSLFPIIFGGEMKFRLLVYNSFCRSCFSLCSGKVLFCSFSVTQRGQITMSSPCSEIFKVTLKTYYLENHLKQYTIRVIVANTFKIPVYYYYYYYRLKQYFIVINRSCISHTTANVIHFLKPVLQYLLTYLLTFLMLFTNTSFFLDVVYFPTAYNAPHIS